VRSSDVTTSLFATPEARLRVQSINRRAKAAYELRQRLPNTYKRLGLYTGAAAVTSGLMRLRSGKRYRPGFGFTRRVRFRGSQSLSTSRNGRARPAGVRSGQGVTVQHDARQIYQKRSMPYRQKRRWKKFSRRVNAVAEKDFGSRMVVFNTSQSFTNATSGNHGIAYCGLYTANGTSDSFQADLNSLSALENTGNPTAAAGETVQDSTRWIFKSAILDITVRNTTYNTILGVAELDSTAKLEVDVYEIISSRQWSDTVANYSTANSALGKGATMQLNIGGAGTAAATALRGVTPWEFPSALSYWKMKILKKTKYFLNNGDQFTYQIRDPKRRVIQQEKMQTIQGGNKPGWTRHLFIIFKATPGFTLGTGTDEITERLTIGITRKYFYKIEGMNDDRDRYIVG